MNNQLRSVHVRRYKGINDAALDAAAINVLIGANNSGKSSLVQVIHFGVAVLQAVGLANAWSRGATSLSPAQLHYSPCADLYALGHHGRLVESADSAIDLSYVLADGEKIDLQIRKGRNGNINVKFENAGAARALANLEKPYTIYSPGLAGIARSEMFVSDGVLLRTIARGDANLVLRNVLLRLSRPECEQDWGDFLDDLQKLFGEVDIKVRYNDNVDEHIMVYTKTGDGEWVPIELAGTGVLQAIQILGYVHFFHPSVILLDEPDSHLHPNNQRLLCKLLQGVAEERDTQVFLTTHSRHVVDALSGQAAFQWVRNGTVERMGQDHDLAVLLDIGALDVKEMLSKSQAKCIVLTEDSIKRGLEVLLEASAVPMDETLVLAYYGCTSVHNLRPLLELIRVSNPTAKIIVHRDRDYLTDNEATDWEKSIRNMGAEPFLTVGVDVEAHFLSADHLAALNNKPEDEIRDLILQATNECRAISIEKYVNGRTDLEKKAGTFGGLNLGQLAASAPGIVDSQPERYRHAKTVMRAVRRMYQEKYGQNMRVQEVTDGLAVPSLVTVSAQITA